MTKGSTERDRRRVWQVPALDDLTVVALYHSNHVFPRHMHDTYSIGVNLRGAHASRYRGARHVLPPSSVAVVNPQEPHTGEKAGARAWSFFGLYPSTELMATICRDVGPGGDPHFRGPRVDDADLLAGLRDVHAMLEAGAEPLRIESALTELLGDLLRDHAVKRPELRPNGDARRGVARARDYVHEQFNRRIELADLASLAQLSPYHFLRVFRQEIGLTPHAYLTQVRIDSARRLLASGEDIARVAFQVGFCDQSHLTHRFKEWVGVTPAEYREASRV